MSATALRAGSVPGVVAAFVLYAVGMGSVVLALSLAVAFARGSVATRVRRAGPVLTRVGGALLVLAGAYVAWYGVVEVRVLSGDVSPDPVVSAVTAVQAAATRSLAGLGAAGIAVLALALTALAAGLVATRGREPAPVGRHRAGQAAPPAEDTRAGRAR